MNQSDTSLIPNRAVAIFSGGMDSFTLLNELVQEGKEVFALSFNYGQRHSKELECARQVCESLNIAHKIIDITAINSLLAGSSLTDDIQVPEGHYEEENMKSTVVPNRNMILLSLAIGYAVSLKAEAVYYGAHGGDHAIYPDCRPAFVEIMSEASKLANYEPVEVRAPYLYETKIEILRRGLALGLDYGQTWTCYNGREKACGKCGSCVERLEAFDKNDATDPLAYESVCTG
ncbi:predicted PP-loop superfamily ATPase [Hahella chejuensis KCTC 2396]|uniref:7-cyano-7-deazaguanine synthase n=1 Tax=Hahella chejuensis (strain KCTC 2396) TaxID=349521 RepID=QUEC_HAHCH|nr:7-cyano-7-deazaguanine synthase QueC [Hahella chejuensis]Q2S7U9.1 RecName: Full=7-cyano-7-deazaguanine synthase; AltName: Full=7-cyano-7-carbaguanine synthase; AltName: Full=PreQ(0) synthase; AltName: Full=Queuosine biosynthesis protein QueC [Hahella chejuensis KCTC 2396]ABC33275.1 predicted PP-loop superfamily ATPase [Hahella chejuensis KCTC 2396]